MPESGLDIFLLIGQSNMAGRGSVDQVEPLRNANVLMLRHGEWVAAQEPLHHDKQIAGTGLGMSFAVELAEQNPSSVIGLVPAAIGGTGLKRWMPGAYLYRRAVLEARQATQSGSIKGILWHQGESDAQGEATATSYAERFTIMVEALRRELGCQRAPVVVGELGEFLTGRPGLAHFAEVNRQLHKLAETLPLCGCVSAAGLKDKGDSLHFDSPSLRAFGRRYAEVYRRLAAEGGVRLGP